MGALYGEAEQQQMRDFWGRWADQHDSVAAGGDLRIPNRSARLTFLKTIKMTRR